MNRQSCPLLALLALVAACGPSGTPMSAGTCHDNPTYPPAPYGSHIGETVADFSLRVQTGVNGTPAAKKLSDYRAECIAGTLKVLAIFGAAEWCVPCVNEQPELEMTYSDYQAAGAPVAFIVAVTQKTDHSAADDGTEKSWASTHGITFDLASDPGNALAPYFDPNSFPNTMIIDLDDMTIHDFWTGAKPGLTKQSVDEVLQ